MKKFPLKFGLLLSCLFLVVAGQGCVQKHASIPQTGRLTCDQAAAADSVAPEALAHILAEARQNPDMEGCWTPLMKQALNRGWTLPMADLTLAIHRFNRSDSPALFSAAVHQYLVGIVNGKAGYGARERRLLAAYLRFVIEHAPSKQDIRLKQARLLCLRLDSELYQRFFGVNFLGAVNP
ncbi:MAG: hypothetical protein MI747_18275 [Desulfobacterales bacterium]|nr:hypothetical protein [Desulfobacterales bacterium]